MCGSPTSHRCMQLTIHQNASYFGFYSDECTSTTIVQANQWHHFAFVYDYPTSTQTIYLNGLCTGNRTSLGPFLAENGTITIGAFDNGGPAPFLFYSGYLDDVLYVSRAKTESEVLSDATLVAYYSFDNGSLFDLGPNRINGVRPRSKERRQ